MRVFMNGFPKSGNHALWKACELLGVPGVVNHEAFDEKYLSDKNIFIKRDPRNVIVSMLRMNKQSVTDGMFITRFRKFQQRSLIDDMAEYEPWLSHNRVLVVRYEDLIKDDRTMREIAKHLDIPYLRDAYKHLPGHTRTWNIDRSDYCAIWSDAVEQVWCSEGGPELLTRWGY